MSCLIWALRGIQKLPKATADMALWLFSDHLMSTKFEGYRFERLKGDVGDLVWRIGGRRLDTDD